MRQATREVYEARIEIAAAYILENLDIPLTPGDVAAEAGFSRFHFGRVFAAALGESIAEFVRRIRLERAACRLGREEATVGEAALEAGYESVEAFNRAFKSFYLVPPSRFRAAGARLEIHAPSGVHYSPDGSLGPIRICLTPGKEMTATVEAIEPMRAVALRHIGPYHLIGEAFGKLHAWAGPAGAPTGLSLAIFHDDMGAVPPDQLRSDACIVIPAGYALPEGAPEGVSIIEIPGGDYAVGVHMGPYSGLGEAWGRFVGEAIPALKRPIDGKCCFEVYVNDCSQTPPEKLETRLYESLAPLA